MMNNEPKLLNDNAAWCWFQGERAIVHNGVVLFGSCAAGNGAGGADRDGDIELTGWTPATGEVRRTTLHKHLQADDHCVPALYVRKDGRLFASYSMHGDLLRRWRISARPGDISEFELEQTLNLAVDGEKYNYCCYQNVYRLSAEGGRLYNFLRGKDANPAYTLSDDDGATWRYGGKFLNWPRPVTDPKFTGMDGARPYPRYASNGVDSIHVLITEDHPRAYDNSIYHGVVRGGKIFHSDGRPIGELSTTHHTNIKPTDLTLIFAGDADNVAWTSDLRLDAQGLPYGTFSVQKGDGDKRLMSAIGGEDIRYYYARFDGKNWRTHEIAYGGRRLCPAEVDYSGLATVHPYDPNLLYISTNADPQTGKPLISQADGQRHHEIFRGRSSNDGASWTWTPITRNSRCDNLRPIVPPGDPKTTAVLWFRGAYPHFIDFRTEAVGIIDQL